MKNTRYSCQILKKLEFSRQIFEKQALKYRILLKSVQSEPSCSMDRQTGMTKLTVVYHNFENPPTKAKRISRMQIRQMLKRQQMSQVTGPWYDRNCHSGMSD